MSVYVESSALLKIYIDEPETEVAAAALAGRNWVSGRHTLVEVRRNLVRLVAGEDYERARQRFDANWLALDAVDLGESGMELAARLAERTGVRSLDAMHLGAAALAGAEEGLPIVTFDRRLAEAARSLGWAVLP